MQGKTVVITGATSGIGEVAAVRLAEQGARIVFTARDKARADDTLAALKKANPNAGHAVHMADLSRLAVLPSLFEGLPLAALEAMAITIASSAKFKLRLSDKYTFNPDFLSCVQMFSQEAFRPPI